MGTGYFFSMARLGSKWWVLRLMVAVNLLGCVVMVSGFVSKTLVNVKDHEEVSLSSYNNTTKRVDDSKDFFTQVGNFLWQPTRSNYRHVWPVSHHFHSMYDVCNFLWVCCVLNLKLICTYYRYLTV